MIKLPCQ